MGPWAPNRELREGVVHHSGILAPESFAFGDQGLIYTTTGDGIITVLDSNATSGRNLLHIGSFIHRLVSLFLVPFCVFVCVWS